MKQDGILFPLNSTQVLLALKDETGVWDECMPLALASAPRQGILAAASRATQQYPQQYPVAMAECHLAQEPWLWLYVVAQHL